MNLPGSYISDHAALQAEAADRNFKRWPILGKYCWPNVKWFDSYGLEVQYLRQYYEDRLEWLNRALGQGSTRP